MELNLYHSSEKDMWLAIMQAVLREGKYVHSRNLECLEIENFSFIANPYNRFANFKERKLNLKYIVGELIWYLRGDLNDKSIEHYSKFWTKIKNLDSPIFYSNYGYYIYEQGQFDRCFNALRKDPDTRQAVIMLCNSTNLEKDTNDKICTYSISFRIRDNKLNMTVNMRSNDLVRGLMIDFFQFSIVMELMLVILNRYVDQRIEMGTYTHNVDSFHLYAEHFDMVNEIVDNNGANYQEINCPKITTMTEYLLLRTILPSQEKNILNNEPIRHYTSGSKFMDWCIKNLQHG